MELSPTWISWDAGIDYFRATCARDDEKSEALEAFAFEELIRANNEGHDFTTAEWFKYEGASVGKLFYGKRWDGALFQVSSAPAHAVALRALQLGLVSLARIDLQITGKLEGVPVMEWLRAERNRLEAEDARRQGPPGVTLGWDAKKAGGGMLTLGARTSNRWGKIYDKSAEQKWLDEPNLVRFEVEFKAQQAQQVASTLRQAHDPTRVAIDLCRAFFGNRGIDINFVGGGHVTRLPSSYVPTDDERRKRWIKRNVAPSVHKLIESGHGQEIYGFLTKDGLLSFNDDKHGS